MKKNCIANKDDIIKCLIERQNGRNIQESNKYISGIEVNNIFIYKQFYFIEKFHEYQSFRRIIFRKKSK
jgi:hypothetical protein